MEKKLYFSAATQISNSQACKETLPSFKIEQTTDKAGRETFPLAEDNTCNPN